MTLLFRNQTLKTRILISYLLIIFMMGTALYFLGINIIHEQGVKRAQGQVERALNSIRGVYLGEITQMKMMFSLIDNTADISTLREKLELDYLYKIDLSLREQTFSEIVAAAFLGNDIGGTRIISPSELSQLGIDPDRKKPIRVRETPRAAPTQKDSVQGAMAIEYARPFFDETGKVKEIIYGGKVLNRNYRLIDRMHTMVFEDKFYENKPVGTVTIFQDDVRVSTNVLDASQERAIGTRVSQIVYENVIEKGLSWVDRAFVVTDWYLTAYEPIYDINGNRIGILYVGLLEKPYSDSARRAFVVFLQIVVGIAVIAVIIAFFLAAAVTRPIKDLTTAVNTYTAGELNTRVSTDTNITELNSVGQAFNNMAMELNQREKSLKETNQKLNNLNRSYLDLISFVSHELKGVLSTVMMSAYTIKDGFLGELNEGQKKTMNLITLSLDYLTGVVKNFLNLSRIEKGEMQLNKSMIEVKEGLLAPLLDSFAKSFAEKELSLKQDVAPGLRINADPDLILMALNNLVGNAVKYTPQGGTIRLSVKESGQNLLLFEVFNSGRPITPEEHDRLFKKFSRLKSPETRKVQGTGLGLFITKEIIERHDGSIRHEARENGNAFIFYLPGNKE